MTEDIKVISIDDQPDGSALVYLDVTEIGKQRLLDLGFASILYNAMRGPGKGPEEDHFKWLLDQISLIQSGSSSLSC